MENQKLLEEAKKARKNAYTPISGFQVGAALLTKEGEVYHGCNIEDPSGIGTTNICAERCAVVKAVSEGDTEFEKIAVVGGKGDNLIFTTPCGVCRQYLNSFAKDIKIVCQKENGAIIEYTIEEILPHAFEEEFTNQDKK